MRWTAGSKHSSSVGKDFQMKCMRKIGETHFEFSAFGKEIINDLCF